MEHTAQAENGEWRAKYHKLMQDKAELLRAKHEQADAATSLAMEKRALERQVGELSSQLAALQALLSHEEADSVSLANKLTALEKEARMMAAAARSVSRMQTQALAAATIASSSPMKAASLYSGSPSAGSSLRPVSALSPRSPHRL